MECNLKEDFSFLSVCVLCMNGEYRRISANTICLYEQRLRMNDDDSNNNKMDLYSQALGDGTDSAK